MKALSLSLLLVVLSACAAVPPVADDRLAVAQVRALERDWLDAYVGYDIEAMRQLLADEFLITFKHGAMQDKAELLAMLAEQGRSPDPRLRFHTREVQARVHGDTVMLFGVVTMEYTGDDGAPREDVARYTDTWVRRGGRWQVVASALSEAGD